MNSDHADQVFTPEELPVGHVMLVTRTGGGREVACIIPMYEDNEGVLNAYRELVRQAVRQTLNEPSTDSERTVN